MMRKILKQEKGVTLISLAAVIIVMGIITTMLMYSIRDTNDTGKLTNLYSDIDNLTDKVSNYYATYGQIPAIDTSTSANMITEISSVVNAWQDSPVGANDTGRFLVLDLNAIENLTLNYGKEFEKIKTANTIGNHRDFYIINENSHNIFYLKGVKVNNKYYYTNQDKDTEAVNLRYVDGIKIPDGYNYLSGNKTTGIIITNGTKQYKYEDGVYKNYVEGGEGDGTTISVELTESDERAWSLPYDTTTTYKDSNGDNCYIPAGFMVSKLDDLNTIKKGLVIKKYTPDSEIEAGKTRMDYGDEYVWISVPFEVMKNATIKTVDLTEASAQAINEASKEVEDALIEYAKDYREEGYEDTYYEGCGISREADYYILKYNMLKSIYENGGFYVGRYEAGCNVARTSGSATNTAAQVQTTSGIPLSQKDKYPYYLITVSQAQGLSYSTNSNYTTSLMFGIQWDLICKFIEEGGAKSQYEIKEDSTKWGNFIVSNFYITSNNAYRRNNGGTTWVTTTSGESKNKNSVAELTSGACNTNNAINIFDLAGNYYEFTLEKRIDGSGPTSRGGSCWGGSGIYLSYRSKTTTASSCGSASLFRVCLFK